MSELLLLKYSLLAFTGIGTATVGGSLLIRRTLNGLAQFFVVAFAALFLFFVDIYIVEPNWIEIHHVQIHDKELTKILGATKMVQITDLHMTRGIRFREWRLIQKINQLKPELIFITGDFVDGLDQIPAMNRFIKSLHARVGIFGVPGDTDEIFVDGHSLAKLLQPSGLQMLVNENRKIDLPNRKTLWLLGRDYPGYDDGESAKSLNGIPPGVPILALTHLPQFFDQAVRQRINLVLAGDTHGGQVGIPWLVRLSEYAYRGPYMNGLFKKEKTQMYVNRGIGTKTLPIRFLCRPEIAVIEITG